MKAADILTAALQADEGPARDILFRAAQVADLRERIIGCNACSLRKTCTSPVPWEAGRNGDISSICIIGEAPGADEDRAGQPFVGRAGQLLNTVLTHANLDRKDVSLVNSICCRPPRNDFEEAVKADAPYRCSGFLEEQINMTGAWLLVPVGARAFQALFPTHGGGITQNRGKLFWRGRHIVMPTFHPAYALRNPEAKGTMIADFQAVNRVLLGVESAPTPKSYDPSKLISAMRPEPLTAMESKAFQSAWSRKGWVYAYSTWLEDTVILVRDELTKVPDQITGVRYMVKELAQLAAIGTRTWEDARRLHYAKREFNATIL